MSIEHMAMVLHHSKSKGTAKLVLLGIANHQGDGGAWPSVATLATYANVDARTVQRAIRQLVGRGELAVHSQAGGTRDTEDHSRPNLYEVLTSCPSYCDRSPNHRDTRKLGGRQLWIRGVTPTSGGDASVTPPLTPVSPGGVTPVSPEPSYEPRAKQVGAQPQDARTCETCGYPQARCALAQSKLQAEDRHTYSPVARP